MIENPDFPRVSFFQLLNASAEIRENVREMRNEDAVRLKMFSHHIISREEHNTWLASLENNQKRQVWVVMLDEKPVGVVLLDNIEMQHETSNWAFYLTGGMQGSGLGGIVEYILLDYFFNVLKYQKLNCEVIATNPAVVRMHQKFGFAIEGVKRENILFEGQRHDVHQLGIVASEWALTRHKIFRFVERIYESLST